jgi:hypothetical protein
MAGCRREDDRRVCQGLSFVHFYFIWGKASRSVGSCRRFFEAGASAQMD